MTSTALTAPELEALRRLAVQVARRCGELIEDRPADLGVAATKSSEVDIVTVMDRRSEDLATSLLSAARPDDGLLGEEGVSRAGRTGITWVVDPIDGTVNYLYRIPSYSVSVAAVVGDPTVPGAWQPVASAVHNPVTGETFHAAQGAGAVLADGSGERTLRASDADRLEVALIGTGFGYDAARRAEQGRLVARLLPQVRDIRRLGSAALDLCAVACGRLDGYYEQGINAWDLAGGWLVAAEAGARVSGADGAAPSPTLTVAAAPGIADALLSALRESGG